MLPNKPHLFRKYPVLIDLISTLLIFSFAYALTVYRINQAPDLFTDEIIYTRIGIRTAGEGALVWDSGEPFLVHPPLYFIAEATYFTFAGDPNTPLFSSGDIFASVTNARHINAFFAGLTAVSLYFFGKRLHSRRLGLLLALFFSLDPFVLRINRRAMLETLAGFLSVTGMAVFFGGSLPGPARRSVRAGFPGSILPTPGVIIAGVIFGLALLTKELVFTVLIVVMLFGVFELIYSLSLPKRSNGSTNLVTLMLNTIFPALITTAVAILTYALYPLWVLTTGGGNVFSHEKILGFERLLGLIQLTGWNRPGVSMFDFLWRRLADYGSSYFLIALGGAATLGLILWARHLRPARLLITWGLVLYPFYAFVALAGSGNDQFFYYLLVPAIILVGYTAVTLSELKKIKLPLKRLSNIMTLVGHWGDKVVPLTLLLLVVPYGMVRWWQNYGVGVDDGYARFTHFVQANLPSGEPVNASGDPIKFHYFFSDRPIFDAATPAEAIKFGVHYFALTPKDVQFRYGEIRPELASWIQSNGKLLFSFHGDSYGDIFLYYVDHPGRVTSRQIQGSEGAHWRSFHPAKAGFVGLLVTGLFIWLVLWGLLILITLLLRLSQQPGLSLDGKTSKVTRLSVIALLRSLFSL